MDYILITTENSYDQIPVQDTVTYQGWNYQAGGMEAFEETDINYKEAVQNLGQGE